MNPTNTVFDAKRLIGRNFADTANDANTEWRIDDEDVLELFLSEYASTTYPRLMAVVVDKVQTDASIIHSASSQAHHQDQVQTKSSPAGYSASAAFASAASVPDATSHTKPSNFRTVPCAHYNSGFCKNGDACTFLHCCKHCGGDHPRLNYCNEPKNSKYHNGKRVWREDDARSDDRRVWREDDARSDAGSVSSKHKQHSGAGGGAARHSSHQSEKACHGWNNKGGCKQGDDNTCNFQHVCTVCDKTSHGSTTCPEKKQYYCKRCNVSMKGEARYKAHVATEEHQEKDMQEKARYTRS